jgi:hypothetical protein
MLVNPFFNCKQKTLMLSESLYLWNRSLNSFGNKLSMVFSRINLLTENTGKHILQTSMLAIIQKWISISLTEKE